jgi:hypothetical protein
MYLCGKAIHRYLNRWAASRRKPVLRQMGIDEIYLGFLRIFDSLWLGVIRASTPTPPRCAESDDRAMHVSQEPTLASS